MRLFQPNQTALCPTVALRQRNGTGASFHVDRLSPLSVTPATVLAKRGWTEQTFQPGDPVVATGHPSRAPGTYGLEQRGIERADGSPIVR